MRRISSQRKEVHCVGGVFSADQMKRLFPILLLVFSVGVGVETIVYSDDST